MGLREAIDLYDKMDEPAPAMKAAGSVIEEARKLIDAPITDEHISVVIEWSLQFWDRYYIPDEMTKGATPEERNAYNAALHELTKHCRAALTEIAIQARVAQDLEEHAPTGS